MKKLKKLKLILGILALLLILIDRVSAEELPYVDLNYSNILETFKKYQWEKGLDKIHELFDDSEFNYLVTMGEDSESTMTIYVLYNDDAFSYFHFRTYNSSNRTIFPSLNFGSYTPTDILKCQFIINNPSTMLTEIENCYNKALSGTTTHKNVYGRAPTLNSFKSVDGSSYIVSYGNWNSFYLASSFTVSNKYVDTGNGNYKPLEFLIKIDDKLYYEDEFVPSFEYWYYEIPTVYWSETENENETIVDVWVDSYNEYYYWIMVVPSNSDYSDLLNEDRGLSQSYTFTESGTIDVYIYAKKDNIDTLVEKHTIEVNVNSGTVTPPPSGGGDDKTNEQLGDISDKLGDLNSNITDETPPDLNGLVNSAGWLPPGPVDSILNLPLTMFNSLVNNLGNQCTPLTVPIPYVNSNITLPCLNSIYAQINGLSIWIDSIAYIASAFILYSYFMKLYKWVDNTLTFRENNLDDWGGV